MIGRNLKRNIYADVSVPRCVHKMHPSTYVRMHACLRAQTTRACAGGPHLPLRVQVWRGQVCVRNQGGGRHE